MITASTRVRLRTLLPAVAVALVYGVAACGGDGGDLPEPAPPRGSLEQTQGPELTAEEQQAVEEVKAS